LIVTTMESLSVRLSDTIIVLSEADREDVKQLYGVNDGVVVIPLGE